MTTAYWCVFIAFLLPYFWIVLAKVKAPGMNNLTPRLALEKLDGWKQRAYWAHQNAFEAFSPFAAAVIIAHQLQVNQAQLNMLALVFIIARISHGIFYIQNWATARSLVWFVGLISVILIFCLA